MNRNYFKSKLFLKYTWSYLFILLIPLIFTSIFIYENASHRLRSEIERSHLDQLTQAETIIDGRMKELSEIATRISYDHRLASYLVHDPIHSGEAIEALDQYKATSSIIGELYLYFHKDDRIYSSEGMNHFDVFTSNLLFQNWDKDAVYQDLNNVKFPTMRPADIASNSSGRKQSMLAYLIPIKPNNPNPYGTVMYLIRKTELTSLIDSILGSYQGQTYILDNQGQILVDNRQGETLSDTDTRSLFGHLTPGIQKHVLNGKEHSIVSVRSPVNGWTYVTIMPSEQFFSSVLHVRSFIIMLLIFVVAAGAAIALLLARMQYRPISTLVEFAASKCSKPIGRPGESRNELDRIRTTLLEYSARVDLQEPFARHHLLSMLLRSGSSRILTPELREVLDLRFDRSLHFVMVIGWMKSDKNGVLEHQEILELLTHIELPNLNGHGYGVELSQLGQIGLLVNFDPDKDVDEFEHKQLIVEALRIRLLESCHIQPVIGVGSSYTGPDQLNQSYIEACSAYDLRVSSNAGSVNYFEKQSYPTDQSFWIPNNTLLKLSQSLKQGSFEVASQMIKSAVLSLRQSELSTLLIRCIGIDLLNTILKTAAELENQRLIQEMAPQMISGQSLDELERNLLHLASRLCEQVEQANQKEEQSLTDRMIAYIEEHFADNALSLETVASEFSLSPSHVSRSFKEKMGVNFVQYIWQKRLEEVMHQLKTTDDSLKDIIIRVGYVDAPNFIRKFKKETGYTPGQYRKMFSLGQ
ncbi:helix-turn-helix domain-containing protein [Paenibacillus sp. BK720]|uniref:helix-turn-helix domain-containing protein n=1 Tax=Paenibacillus sp. BK720 TaxID=2587092 RepID=UPI0014242809|nr:helix-turn-helix domain-containing protein [Paenibacillus sp. BK720]NIK66898.1 AraC-like DNA-binding protein [Paenibacillus sp. BK720]